MNNIDIVKQVIGLLEQYVPPGERQPLRLIDDAINVLGNPKASDRCKAAAEIFQRQADESYGNDRHTYLYLAAILQISAAPLAEREKALGY